MAKICIVKTTTTKHTVGQWPLKVMMVATTVNRGLEVYI